MSFAPRADHRADSHQPDAEQQQGRRFRYGSRLRRREGDAVEYREAGQPCKDYRPSRAAESEAKRL